MRYLSFKLGGRRTYGIMHEGGIIDLGDRFKMSLPDFNSYLQAVAFGFSLPRFPSSLRDCTVNDIIYEPVCSPNKIICVGMNYEKHRKETGRNKTEYPTLFSRFPETLIGHRSSIVRPHVSTELDFEGELAVVIGRSGRRIPSKEALSFIAGYSCFNDGSIRDWQRHTHQFLPGKNFSATAPFGPELVTPEECGSLESLQIETRLNGVVMQSALLGDMIFSVAEIIEYISTFTTLDPGDVIATGTPGGVGSKREPPVFMKSGDTVEVIVERVGHLINDVVEESVS